MARKKRKNQSLYDEVIELEHDLPLERQRLIDMDEAHAKAHAAQVEKITSMEQQLSSGRDALFRDLFLNQVGEYGIRAVYAQFGKAPPDDGDELSDGPSLSEDEDGEDT